MSRTQGNSQYDTPTPDGIITIGALGDMQAATGGGTAAFTKVATGEWSLRISTTTATSVGAAFSGIVRRYGMQDFMQEQFGTSNPFGAQGLPVGWPTTLSTANATAGSNVNVAVLSSVNFAVGQFCLIDTVASGVQETALITAIPDGTHITFGVLANSHISPFPIAQNKFTTPAGVTGIPPFTGVTQLTPVTSFRPRGILIKQITPRYVINTANLATNTIGITETQYANGTSPTATVNTILTNAANGLATAFSTNVYVTPIPIPVANQKFFTFRNSDIIIEWDVTNTGVGTVDLLGIDVDISFNVG